MCLKFLSSCLRPWRGFSDNRHEALRSFIYPALLYPFILWAFSIKNPGHGADVLAFHALATWGGIFGWYALVYYLAHSMKKLDYFWQFVHMANASAILSFMLLLPIFLTLYAGGGDGAFFTQYWAFFIVADLAFNAFIVASAMRLNLPLGVFVAVTNLFLSDLGNRLLLFYADHADKVV